MQPEDTFFKNINVDIIINVKNSCAASYFGGNCDIVLFSGLINELKVQKNSNYLKYKSYNIIINVFIVTFEQFNASLLNKSIHLFKKN